MSMSEKCRNNNNNMHNNNSNSDNPLTSRRTDGGKKRIVHFFVYLNLKCVGTYIRREKLNNNDKT